MKPKKIKFQLFAFIAADVLLWFLATLVLFEVSYRVWGETVVETRLFSFLETVFCAVLLVIFIIPLLHYLVKKIDRPVQYLIGGLTEISSGNYSCRLTQKTQNEFDSIYSAFNSMSEKLQEAEIRTEQNTKERTLLFANMAHDLKTPITVIQGYSQAMLDGIVSEQNKLAEYAEAIQRKAVHMNRLVDRLFEYAKLESPENILHCEIADLTEVLRTAIASLYTEFEERKIEMAIAIPDEKIMRAVDRLETTRAITNLLANVLAHNPPGIQVLVTLDAGGQITIADSGNPIPPKIAEHLFCPFVSGDESRLTKNGSGLGLAIAQKIMEKQNGKLTYLPDYPGCIKAFRLEFA